MHYTEEQICNLYAQGKSAQDISNDTTIHVRQVYRILDRCKIPRRSTAEQMKLRSAKAPLTFSPLIELNSTQDKLRTAALMLYWGEGAKTGNTVDLANSSPAAVKLFLNYLRKICQVRENKLRFYLYCFARNDCQRLISFWVKELKVRRQQFTKPYIRDARLTNSTRVMPWGVLHVRYSDKKLLNEILRSCEVVFKELENT
jgi:hypothetical protein